MFHTERGEVFVSFLESLTCVAVFCSWCFGFVML